MSACLHTPPAPDFHELIWEVRPRLLAYFRSNCKILGYDADDLVQETLLRVLRQYEHDAPSEGRVTALVFRVARRVLREFLSRGHVEPEIDQAPILRPACPSPRGVVYICGLLREVGKIIQSAFNELRGRATFRREEMARALFHTLATQRTWFLLHGAHPPRLQEGSSAADLSEPTGMMCSRFAPAAIALKAQ